MSVKAYSIYKESTGEIIRTYTGTRDPNGFCGQDESYVEGFFCGETYYVDHGTKEVKNK